MARTHRQIMQAKERRRVMAQLRQDNDRHVRERKPRQEEATVVVRHARARQIGQPKGDVLHPIYGSDAGRAIDHIADDWGEALRLWQVWCDLDTAHAVYCGRVFEVRRHPATGRVDLIHERLETSADAAPADTRSEEERHRDAVDRWRLWEQRLCRLKDDQRTAVVGVLWGRIQPVRDGRVLKAGVLLTDGLRRLREECEKGR